MLVCMWTGWSAYWVKCIRMCDTHMYAWCIYISDMHTFRVYDTHEQSCSQPRHTQWIQTSLISESELLCLKWTCFALGYLRFGIHRWTTNQTYPKRKHEFTVLAARSPACEWHYGMDMHTVTYTRVSLQGRWHDYQHVSDIDMHALAHSHLSLRSAVSTITSMWVTYLERGCRQYAFFH